MVPGSSAMSLEDEFKINLNGFSLELMNIIWA